MLALLNSDHLIFDTRGSCRSPNLRQYHRTVTQPIRPETLRSTGISLSEKETRDYLSQQSPGLQGRPFTAMSLMDQQTTSRNKQAVPLSKVRLD